MKVLLNFDLLDQEIDWQFTNPKLLIATLNCFIFLQYKQRENNKLSY